jgi:GTP-binding protein Era
MCALANASAAKDATKAGYVAIIGQPNAGKSTLMNAIMGVKLSIVTPKPQTTRKRILGIYTDASVQMIFLDTPGILNPKYKMQSVMMDYVNVSIAEADCILYIYDISKDRRGRGEKQVERMLNILPKDKPAVLLLNKLDLMNDRKGVLPLIAEFSELGIFKDIIPISALRNSNVDDVIATLAKYMPASPFYYDGDLLSTQPERFFVSEIIRENIFMSYSDEIPYSTEVNIVDFKEREHGKWYISAEIIIERPSQKGIIIGHKGEKLKNLLERSRHSIEEHLEMPIYLDCFVKVREKWRDNATYLHSFGY